MAPLLAWLSTLRRGADRYYPPTDSTSYDAMLKDTYDNEAVLNSLNQENEGLAWMESVEADPTQGRQHVIPIRKSRNFAAGAIPVRGALPQAGRSEWDKWLIDMRVNYTRVGIDRWTMNRTRNDRGAFEEAWGLEMKKAVEDLAFVRNRQTWGYGKGVLAKVTGSHVAQTTVELKDPGGVVGTFLANRYIQIGMFVHVIDGTTPTTIKGYGTVTAVNADGTDITLDTAVTCTTGDLVVPAQSATQNSYNVEPEGFLAMVDAGTYVAVYHNITRASVPVSCAQVITSVGTLSADAMQQWIDAVSIAVGGTVDVMTMHHDTARAYLALTELDRRYTGTDLTNPDAGTKRAKKPSGKGSLAYGNIPFLVDRDHPFGMVMGLKKNTFMRLVWPDVGWADEQGIVKWVQGFDEFTAYYRLPENPHCTEPARNFRADGITTSQLVVRSL